MRGNNHDADCDCEWCLNVGWNVESSGGGGLHWGSTGAFPSRVPAELDDQPEPNAKCPHCFELVHFRALDNGGRVYFDSLGPPWPKHQCMASSASGVGGKDIGSTKSRSVEMQSVDDGVEPGSPWTPVKFFSQKKGSRGDSPALYLGWTTIRLRNTAESRWESWLVTQRLPISTREIAYRSPPEACGRARLNFLHQHAPDGVEATECAIWSVVRFSEIPVAFLSELSRLSPTEWGPYAIRRQVDSFEDREFFPGAVPDQLAVEIDRVAKEWSSPDWQNSEWAKAAMRLRVTEVASRFLPKPFERVLNLMKLVVAFY